MAQLIFRVVRCDHRVSDFFVQQFPVTLAQSIERLVHSVFSHSKLMPNLRLGRALAVVGKQFLQLLKQRTIASRTYSSSNRASTCSKTVNAQRRSKIRSALKVSAGSRSAALAREQFVQ